MKELFCRTIGIAIVAMLITGCNQQPLQDESQLANINRHRLIAAENMELREQLTQARAEIEKQKQFSAQILDVQQDALQQCQQEKLALQYHTDRGMSLVVVRPANVYGAGSGPRFHLPVPYSIKILQLRDRFSCPCILPKIRTPTRGTYTHQR